MDKYDYNTVKEITTQYPKDNAINFLLRIIKQQKYEREKVEDGIFVKDDVYKSLKGIIKSTIAKNKTLEIKVANQSKQIRELEAKLKECKELLPDLDAETDD